MTDDSTAADAVRDGEFAFRLTDETPLYETPDASSRVVTKLAAGSIVTVHDRAGDFLHVITPNDSFGFIPASTPVNDVEAMSLAPSSEPPGPNAPPGPSPTAVAAFERDQTPQAARRAADRDWKPDPIKVGDTQRLLIYDRVDKNKRATWVILGGYVIFLALFFAAIGAVIGFSSQVPRSEQVTITLVTGAIAGAISLVIAVIMYRSSTSIVLGISGAHEVTKQQEPVLYRIVENLSIGSGLPMPKVWVIEDSAPNAFATGRNPGEAHVAATRGLPDKLAKRAPEGGPSPKGPDPGKPEH